MIRKTLLFSSLCSISPIWGMALTQTRPILAESTLQDEDTVVLQTNDGRDFEIEVRYAKQSQTIGDLIKDASTDSPIPLPSHISSATWSLILALLQNVYKISTHSEDTAQAQGDIREELQVIDGTALISFLSAVNYLDISILLNFAIKEAKTSNRLCYIPADLLARVPREIRNHLIRHHLANLIGPYTGYHPVGNGECTSDVLSLHVTKNKKIVAGSRRGYVRTLNSTTFRELTFCSDFNYCSVNSVGTNNEGSILLGLSDSTVRVRNNEYTGIYHGHTDEVTSVCGTIDGKAISGSDDGTVHVWNSKTCRQLAVYRGHSDKVTSVCEAHDGRIISGSKNGTVHVWDAETDCQSVVFDQHTDEVTSVCVINDDKAASGSKDRTIRIWNNKTGNQLAICQGHTGRVTSICATKDGRIVSSSLDGTVRVWDSETGLQLLICTHSAPVFSVSVINNYTIVSGTRDGLINKWYIPYLLL